MCANHPVENLPECLVKLANRLMGSMIGSNQCGKAQANPWQTDKIARIVDLEYAENGLYQQERIQGEVQHAGCHGHDGPWRGGDRWRCGAEPGKNARYQQHQHRKSCQVVPLHHQRGRWSLVAFIVAKVDKEIGGHNGQHSQPVYPANDCAPEQASLVMPLARAVITRRLGHLNDVRSFRAHEQRGAGDASRHAGRSMSTCGQRWPPGGGD